MERDAHTAEEKSERAEVANELCRLLALEAEVKDARQEWLQEVPKSQISVETSKSALVQGDELNDTLGEVEPFMVIKWGVSKLLEYSKYALKLLSCTTIVSLGGKTNL